MLRSTVYIRLAFAGGILIVLFFLHWFSLTNSLEKWLVQSFTSLLTRDTSLSIYLKGQYRFFTSKDEFIKTASMCFDKQVDDSIIQIEQKKTADENSELRLLLSFSKASFKKPLLANIISKDVASNNQIIIIDKGSVDGLAVGLPVVAKEGIYIGNIIKTNIQTSAVRLLNDNASKVAVTILNKDKSIGILEGGFGISLKIRFIPRNENIRAGDKVITSGLETTIPRGLAIGTVSVVENEAYQPFQEAVVSPLLDFSKLDIVAVLTDSN